MLKIVKHIQLFILTIMFIPHTLHSINLLAPSGVNESNIVIHLNKKNNSSGIIENMENAMAPPNEISRVIIALETLIIGAVFKQGNRFTFEVISQKFMVVDKGDGFLIKRTIGHTSYWNYFSRKSNPDSYETIIRLLDQRVVKSPFPASEGALSKRMKALSILKGVFLSVLKSL